MTRTLEFIFDFGSPNAYLVHRVLPALLSRTQANLSRTPCLLGGIFKSTGNQAPSLAFAGVQGKMDYERLEMNRFIARHALHRFRMNSAFPLNSLTPMRGLIAAGIAGVEEAYVEAVLAAMWEADRRVDEVPTLIAVLREAGLDGEALLALAGTPDVKQTLIENTRTAVERGVFGIPTFFVGREMFFGKERLAQVEEALQQ